MSIIRSEDVDLYQLIMTKDDCQLVMNEFGQLGKLHIVDLNKDALPFD